MMGSGLSEKALLMSFGYSADQIVEHPDGTATLDLNRIIHDWKSNLSKNWLRKQAGLPCRF